MGVICEKQLRKSSFTLNDLMEELRMGGMLDPAEVGTAVLETSGAVSVFPKAQCRPVSPQDLGLKVSPQGLPLPLVMDGKVNRPTCNEGAHGKLAGQGAAMPGLRLRGAGSLLLPEHPGPAHGAGQGQGQHADAPGPGRRTGRMVIPCVPIG